MNVACLLRDNALLERARVAFAKESENQKGALLPPAAGRSSWSALHVGNGREPKASGKDSHGYGTTYTKHTTYRPKGKFQKHGASHFHATVCRISASWTCVQEVGASPGRALPSTVAGRRTGTRGDGDLTRCVFTPTLHMHPSCAACM